MTIKYPGHGAKERPHHLKVKDHIAGAVLPFDWSNIKEDSTGNVPNLFGISDRDQDGSSSCTCQAMGYGFRYCTGIEISREDIYSHIHLPGGGAYLNAPLDYGRKTGFAPLSKYPDPNPETEQAMTAIVQVQDGDRIRTFQISYKFYGYTIDEAASAITNNQYIHLGIKGNWAKGWDKSWVDPTFQGYDDNNWAHALFAGKESIVLRNGVPAIKAKSSWTQHFDPKHEQVFCHYLTKPYFDAGAVFEIIGVDIKELNDMLTKEQVHRLYALWGLNDPVGEQYWVGKTLDQLLDARKKDQLNNLQNA